ncbi:hypothetical protein CDPW8_0489 [Corynebacterium diphtheriae PW8]|nr:hypothetical protein CDPW8_0489 [Corynebacterium diphtheriae PW8]
MCPDPMITAGHPHSIPSFMPPLRYTSVVVFFGEEERHHN